MPIPARDRESLEAAGFVIRETEHSYLVVPKNPPPRYDEDVSGKPMAVAAYPKPQQAEEIERRLEVGNVMFNTFINSPLVTEYRGKAMRALAGKS